MSFDWHYYLKFAQQLYNELEGAVKNGEAIASQEAEALYRSVVSRSYYSVYCLARNYAKEHDGFESRSNAHQDLQRYLLQSNHKLKRTIGNQLKQLHQDRIKVDYHDVLAEPAVLSANKALARAHKIHENLISLSNNSRVK